MGVGAFNHRVSMEFCAVIGPLIYIYTLCSLFETNVLVVRLKATKTLSRLLACVYMLAREREGAYGHLLIIFLIKKEEYLVYFILVFCFARQETY
mgnify:CR=1 FL=1